MSLGEFQKATRDLLSLGHQDSDVNNEDDDTVQPTVGLAQAIRQIPLKPPWHTDTHILGHYAYTSCLPSVRSSF